MNIGLNEKTQKEVTTILQNVLANQEILYQKLRNFHWNVKGPDFLELHEFFEDMYTDLAEDIDVIAERIRSLDQHTKGTFAEFIELADIKESPNTYPSSKEMIAELLEDNELIISKLRTSANTCGELNDIGNEDILIAQIQKHEKNAWMLRSLLAS